MNDSCDPFRETIPKYIQLQFLKIAAQTIWHSRYRINEFWLEDLFSCASPKAFEPQLAEGFLIETLEIKIFIIIFNKQKTANPYRLLTEFIRYDNIVILVFIQKLLYIGLAICGKSFVLCLNWQVIHF